MYMTSNTLFSDHNEPINNYKKTLDDFISIKNELSKTTNHLKQKEEENYSLLKQLNDLKEQIDKLLFENSTLKKKYL